MAKKKHIALEGSLERIAERLGPLNEVTFTLKIEEMAKAERGTPARADWDNVAEFIIKSMSKEERESSDVIDRAAQAAWDLLVAKQETE